MSPLRPHCTTGIIEPLLRRMNQLPEVGDQVASSSPGVVGSWSADRRGAPPIFRPDSSGAAK